MYLVFLLTCSIAGPGQCHVTCNNEYQSCVVGCTRYLGAEYNQCRRLCERDLEKCRGRCGANMENLTNMEKILKTYLKSEGYEADDIVKIVRTVFIAWRKCELEEAPELAKLYDIVIGPSDRIYNLKAALRAVNGNKKKTALILEEELIEQTRDNIYLGEYVSRFFKKLSEKDLDDIGEVAPEITKLNEILLVGLISHERR